MISANDTIRLTSETDPPAWLRRQGWRIGRVLRWPYNKRRFRLFGSRSRVDFPSYVVGGRGIEIAEHVQICRDARLEAHFVGSGACRIRIGRNTRIAPHVHIGAAELVEIGADCGIGSFTWITDHDHDTDDPTNCVVANKRVVVAPTVLEDGVYVGERVAILRGVRIGRGSVIGTNSVVTRDVPPFSVAAGSPARVIRSFDAESRTWRRVGTGVTNGYLVYDVAMDV